MQKVLIIGGGTAGMSAAISIRKLNIDVDLLEIDPEWRPDGAGISTNASLLRALNQLGLMDEFQKYGCATNGIMMCKPNGDMIAMQPTASLVEDGIAGVGGILRSDLAKIMASKTRESGTRIFLGQSPTSFREESHGVVVETSDGRSETYDLVVLADGLYSKTRTMFFPEATQPKYVGQAVWRAVLPRLKEIETLRVWLGQTGIKPGINPISSSHIYMFISENVPEKVYVDPATFTEKMKDLLAPFSCPILKQYRELLSDTSMINYRPLENHLVNNTWHRGRIVMIGDAAHGTTPELTAGAMMAAEDGIVLAEEIKTGGDVETILTRFFHRRYDRCRMVVENSEQIGALEIEGGRAAEVQKLMHESIRALAQPI